MHELGVLCHVVRTVDRAAKQNRIKAVKHITLQVGEDSGYVPHFLTKLFPAALDLCPDLGTPELKLEMVPGERLQIKDFGY